MRLILLWLYLLCAFTLSAQPAACLDFSTFFGFVSQDEIRGVCVDPQNNTYVVGNTYNTNLPVTAGAFQSTPKGNYEGYIAKFDSCGYLQWCTYFGSNGLDMLEKVTYSNDNSIVLVGHTNGNNLATTAGCFQPLKAGAQDCFIAKFNLNGSANWITYFGATGGDFVYDVKTDKLANIVIGGTTISTSLHTTSSSFQQTLAGATDAFIARFNKNGGLRFSTLYGGTNSEDIHALALDDNCNIIGTGGSFSNNLSMSAGCFQPTSNGGMEIYVLKLDSSGQRVFSTYLGETGTDDAYGACTDLQGNIYLSGHTNSANFYTSAGAYQSANNGNNDAWVARMDKSGAMQWCTLFGGSMNDFVARMNINSLNELTVLMSSESANLPMLGSNNYTLQSGATDAALLKVMSNGVPFWSTYLGGAAGETPHDLAVFNISRVVVAGATSSSNFPLTGYVYQNSFGGTEDGFISCRVTEVNPLSSISEFDKRGCDPKLVYRSGSAFVLLGADCAAKGKFYIYNVLGQKISEGDLGTPVITLAGTATGVYFLKLELGNSYRELKFVID